MNYQIPTSMIELPSKGLLYNKDSVLSQGKVEFRFMTAKEEDILASKTLLRKGTVLNELLKSCITTPGVDIDEILTCDRNAIYLAIRISGLGAEYSVQNMQCPVCGKSITANFDLSKLNVKNMDSEFIQYPNENKFTVRLPTINEEIDFRLLIGKDEVVSSSDNNTLAPNEQEVTSMLKSMITRIGDQKDINVMADIINYLPSADVRFFKKYVDAIQPGVEMKQKIKCPMLNCKSEIELDIPILMSFFWPE